MGLQVRRGKQTMVTHLMISHTAFQSSIAHLATFTALPEIDVQYAIRMSRHHTFQHTRYVHLYSGRSLKYGGRGGIPLPLGLAKDELLYGRLKVRGSVGGGAGGSMIPYVCGSRSTDANLLHGYESDVAFFIHAIAF